ncbi:MAG: TolC family protein [Desulfuromonadaceae bacterium]|nr:TolC family protein [Desulfuromonadaceae bacterium]
MKKILAIIGIFLLPPTIFAESDTPSYKLPQIIEFALKNEPRLIGLGKNIKAAEYAIDAAKGERWPKVNVGANITRYRYPTATSPIAGSPQSSKFPNFDNDIYDVGVSFRIPLYQGGRLEKAVNIAKITKIVAEGTFHQGKQELIYNLKSTYCKILELEELLKAREQMVNQLKEHRRVTEQFFKAGRSARVDLMKTDVELAHARQQALATQNAMAATYALLRTLMGVDETYPQFTISGEPHFLKVHLLEAEGVKVALQQRPEYRKAKVQAKLQQAKLELTKGKRLPSLDLAGDFTEKSGDSFSFKDNWNIGVRFSYPLLDGGITRAEINKSSIELERSQEELRAIRLSIVQEVKEAFLAVADADKRVSVSKEAISSAEENLRVEQLRYEAGDGTTKDVIDAQTALLRSITDWHQASYDLLMAQAALEMALGSNVPEEVASL